MSGSIKLKCVTELDSLGLGFRGAIVGNIGNSIGEGETHVAKSAGKVVAVRLKLEQIQQGGNSIFFGPIGGAGGWIQEIGQNPNTGNLRKGISSFFTSGNLGNDGGGVLDKANSAVVDDQGEESGDSPQLDESGAVERIQGYPEESLEGVFDGSGERIRSSDDMDQGVHDVALGPDDRSVLVDGQEAVEGSGG